LWQRERGRQTDREKRDRKKKTIWDLEEKKIINKKCLLFVWKRNVQRNDWQLSHSTKNPFKTDKKVKDLKDSKS